MCCGREYPSELPYCVPGDAPEGCVSSQQAPCVSTWPDRTEHKCTRKTFVYILLLHALRDIEESVLLDLLLYKC